MCSAGDPGVLPKGGRAGGPDLKAEAASYWTKSIWATLVGVKKVDFWHGDEAGVQHEHD